METPNTFHPVQLVQCGNYHACGNMARLYQGKPRSYCHKCRADHLLIRARESIDQLGDDGLPFQARLDQVETAIINASSALAQARDAGGSLREAFAAFLEPIAELRRFLDQAAELQRPQLLERAEEIYNSDVFAYLDRWAQVKLLQVLRTLGTERYPSFQRVTWLTYEEEDLVENGRPLRYDEIARALPALERNCDWAGKRAEQDFEQALAQAQPVRITSRSGSKREKSLRDQQLRLKMRGSSGGGKKR